MSAQQRRTPTTAVDVRVSYGFSDTLGGRFPRDEIAGLSVRDLIRHVVEGPQEPGSAARTAKVLADVLETERVIDAEITRASAGDTGEAAGRPIMLDDVVLREGEGGEDREAREGEERRGTASTTDELTIRLSESYVGGGTSWSTKRQSARS